MKVIETDNFSRDYPAEKIIIEGKWISIKKAEDLANAYNAIYCPTGKESRYYKVEDDDYELPKDNFFEP